MYANVSNDDLQKEHFKIMRYLPQLQVLQHSKIKLFLTHCGEGGIAESIYSETLMILYPIAATQHMNARRADELGVGHMIQDREKLTDLTAIIDALLLNESSSKYYQRQIVKIRKMIAFNGGTSEAADFLEYAAEFGTDHFFCNSGHNYSCNQVQIPWFQQTMLDVYLILVFGFLFVVVSVKKCICDRLFNNCAKKSKKYKKE